MHYYPRVGIEFKAWNLNDYTKAIIEGQNKEMAKITHHKRRQHLREEKIKRNINLDTQTKSSLNCMIDIESTIKESYENKEAIEKLVTSNQFDLIKRNSSNKFKKLSLQVPVCDNSNDKVSNDSDFDDCVMTGRDQLLDNEKSVNNDYDFSQNLSQHSSENNKGHSHHSSEIDNNNKNENFSGSDKFTINNEDKMDKDIHGDNSYNDINDGCNININKDLPGRFDTIQDKSNDNSNEENNKRDTILHNGKDNKIKDDNTSRGQSKIINITKKPGNSDNTKPNKDESKNADNKNKAISTISNRQIA